MIIQMGDTALHIAAEKGHVEIVKILLQDERFTEINAKNKVSNTVILILHMIV